MVRTTVRDFCDQFDLPAHDDHPQLEADSASRSAAEKRLFAKHLSTQRLILHPGPSMPVRKWPRESWVKLVALLREKGFTNIGQIGVAKHAFFGDVAVEPIPGATSLVNALSDEEMMGAISLASLYVGIDSGPLHFAVALRTPTVGIFGSTLPEYRFTDARDRTFVVSQVECRGCGHYLAATPYSTDCPYHIRCMPAIAVEDVLAACLGQLGEAAG